MRNYRSFIRASIQPVLDTGAAYASGDLMGGKLTLTDALPLETGCGVISSILMTDKNDQVVDLDLVIFRSNPTGTTFTDQAAFDPGDGDLDKIAGVVTFGSGNRFRFSDNAVKYAGGLSIPIKTAPSGGYQTRTFYAALVARGAHTAASSSDINITFYLEEM